MKKDEAPTKISPPGPRLPATCPALARMIRSPWLRCAPPRRSRRIGGVELPQAEPLRMGAIRSHGRNHKVCWYLDPPPPKKKCSLFIHPSTNAQLDPHKCPVHPSTAISPGWFSGSLSQDIFLPGLRKWKPRLVVTGESSHFLGVERCEVGFATIHMASFKGIVPTGSFPAWLTLVGGVSNWCGDSSLDHSHRSP